MLPQYTYPVYFLAFVQERAKSFVGRSCQTAASTDQAPPLYLARVRAFALSFVFCPLSANWSDGWHRLLFHSAGENSAALILVTNSTEEKGLGDKAHLIQQC